MYAVCLWRFVALLDLKPGDEPMPGLHPLLNQLLALHAESPNPSVLNPYKSLLHHQILPK